jgi:hypothetical protein
MFSFLVKFVCNQSDNDTCRENLAKLKYKLNMKIFFWKHLSIFLDTCLNFGKCFRIELQLLKISKKPYFSASNFNITFWLYVVNKKKGGNMIQVRV